MQADDIQAGVKDLTRKLTNLDPIEAHSAINQYFDTHAVVESQALQIKGADRIKKQLDLYNRVFLESELVGDPKYNEDDQTIEFTVARLFQARVPHFVTYIPYAYRINKYYQYIHYQGILHLNPDGSSTSDKKKPTLLVTKLDLHQKEKPPLQNLIPYYLLKPFLSIASNIIATVASIVLAFPWTPKGLFSIAAALINNFWLWFYDKAADTQEILFPHNPSWAGQDSDLPAIPRQALYTLNYAARTLEERAKQVGVPVDDYKNKVKGIVQNVSDNGREAVKHAEQKGSEVRGRAEKEIRQAMPDNDHTDEDASQGDKARSEFQGHSKSSSGETAPSEHLPHTPLGGTDPTAPNAPSYAEIIDEHNTQDETATGDIANNHKVTAKDDLPHTPLGGTDPTAPGAPSYADIAIENDRSVIPPGLSRSYSHPTSPGAPMRGSREPTMTKKDDLPTTPLGGHDPTAPGAFSYATAAHE